MNISQDKNNIVISEASDFDLTKTFECGQCFRWTKIDTCTYTGIAGAHPLTISQHDDTICFHDTSKDVFFDFWYNYFDLGRNYSDIRAALSADSVMQRAAEYGRGIRILKQDLWETVVSFIISASNNIPRIKRIIESLCVHFGTKLSYQGMSYYTFPAPETLDSLSLEELSGIRAGFRDKYIKAAAKSFVSGELSAEKLTLLDDRSAKQSLMSIYGVGNKVADCIMLFSLQRFSAFPVDVWIKRIMEYCYFDGNQQIKDVQAFAYDKFADLCGFAQQYLFYYARENKIE